MNLKEFLVIRNHEDDMEVWTRAEYDKYIHETLFVGACPAVRIITHFNREDNLLKDSTNEELKEGGGMKSKEEILFPLHTHCPEELERVYRHENVLQAMDEYAAQFAGTREDWVSVEVRMPEHNVGVLVFIPAEDNHITSGMWDISDEWVLLDEYRSPKGEVTHWRKLPNPPNTNI